MTRMCPFRPLIFLPRRVVGLRRIDIAKPPFFLSHPFQCAVDDRLPVGLASRSFLLAHCKVKRVVDAFHSAVPVPELEIVVHRALSAAGLWAAAFPTRHPVHSSRKSRSRLRAR